MNYSVKNKMHSFDFLYPYAARALGLKNLQLTPNAQFEVEYSSNQYCDRNDTPENAMHKITVACKVGAEEVKFVPYRTSGIVESYGYYVYVNGKRVETITPTEWAVIRPNVYRSFAEYFSEMSIAVAAYHKLHREKKSNFILSWYRPYVCSFRDTLPGINADVSKKEKYFAAERGFKPVIIKFHSDEIYGVPVHEDVVITRTIDNMLMVSTYHMN